MLMGGVRKVDFRGGFELIAEFAAGPYRYTQLWRFHADGRMVLPFMPFADLSDDDLTAIISYVRKKYGVIIGQLTAEQVKIKIGAAVPQEALAFVADHARMAAHKVAQCA